jgi:hypothetical protein
MGYIGLPVLKTGRIRVNETVRTGSAPPIAPSVNERQSVACAASACAEVAVQLASRLSASADLEPGSAVLMKTVRPSAAGRSILSKSRWRSPTSGWWRCFAPDRWKRTLWAAQRVRNSALRALHARPEAPKQSPRAA